MEKSCYWVKLRVHCTLSLVRLEMSLLHYQIFQHTVKEAFLSHNRLYHNQQPIIELLCRNIFTDSFLLQLTWDTQQVYCHKIQWLAQNDREIVDLWWEYAKMNDFLPLALTFQKTFSTHHLTKINKLLQLINHAQIPFILQHDEKGKDGSLMWLSIRLGATLGYTIEWQTADTPPMWQIMDDITTEILTCVP